MIQVITNSDSYIKAVLPQIKGLVHSLGLTREDYLQYIQQTYGVERTRQLWFTSVQDKNLEKSWQSNMEKGFDEQ